MMTVLVQSLNKMHIKYVFHNKFRIIIFHDQKSLSLNFKSSRSKMFFKIAVLKNFAIFTIITLNSKIEGEKGGGLGLGLSNNRGGRKNSEKLISGRGRAGIAGGVEIFKGFLGNKQVLSVIKKT